MAENPTPVDTDQSTMRRGNISDFPHVENMYKKTIEYCDEAFGELISTLKNQDIYHQTNLIVTADHGEIFNEHARLESANGSLRKLLCTLLPHETLKYYGLFRQSAFIGHQGIYPYEQLISVPLVTKLSQGETASNDVVEGERELVDIAPTISNLYNQSTKTYQGEDLRNSSGKEYVYSSSQITKGNIVYRSVINNKIKLLQMDLTDIGITDLVNFRTIQSVLSYALADDEFIVDILSGEREKIDNPEMKNTLTSKLEQHIQNCEELNDKLSNSDEKVEFSDDVKQQLEDLGYRQ
jgi:hypothetical protein